MSFNVYSISIIFSLIFLIVVIELVRKGEIQEKYSILWIVMSILLIILASSPIVIERLAILLGIKNPPSFLFLFGLVYLIIYSLHLTVVVSKQHEKITRLAQKIALLEDHRDTKEVR